MLTVAAARERAAAGDRPRFKYERRMCSYCLSLFDIRYSALLGMPQTTIRSTQKIVDRPLPERVACRIVGTTAQISIQFGATRYSGVAHLPSRAPTSLASLVTSLSPAPSCSLDSENRKIEFSENLEIEIFSVGGASGL